MTPPDDPAKVEVPIDAVLGSLQRRISQLVLESAMTEAQVQKLTEDIASLRAENAHLGVLLAEARDDQMESIDAHPANLKSVSKA